MNVNPYIVSVVVIVCSQLVITIPVFFGLIRTYIKSLENNLILKGQPSTSEIDKLFENRAQSLLASGGNNGTQGTATNPGGGSTSGP